MMVHVDVEGEPMGEGEGEVKAGLLPCWVSANILIFLKYFSSSSNILPCWVPANISPFPQSGNIITLSSSKVDLPYKVPFGMASCKCK